MRFFLVIGDSTGILTARGNYSRFLIMASHGDSVNGSTNGSVNGHPSDKAPKTDEAPRLFGEGVEVTLTCQQYLPSMGCAPDDPLSDSRVSGQSSTGISRELSFDSERGPVTCPEFIGEYQVIGLLGRGGMGNVFRVRNPFFNFEQALKMLDARLDSREARKQFITEMRTQAELEHTNVAKVHYAGVCRAKGKYHDQLYFVMALEAGDLGDEIKKRGTYSPHEAANIIRRLAKAIALAHGRGTFHCDLKPKNILMGADGTPKITDFGLVKLLADSRDGRAGRTGAFGTPSYMPPEQADGDFDRVDARSDVYGLGAILYELLTGKPPYQGSNRNEVLWQVKNPKTPPEPVRKLNPRVPARLEAICLRCLEKKPELRFSSANELENELDKILRPHWYKRHWKSLLTIVVVTVLLSAVLLLGYRQYANPRNDAREWSRLGDSAEKLEDRIEDYEYAKRKYLSILEGEFVFRRSSLEQEVAELDRKLQQAIADDWSDQARSRRTEAENARRQGNRDGAIDIYRKLVGDYRDRGAESISKNETYDIEFAETLTKLGELQIERREYTDALKTLDEAVAQLNGNDAQRELVRAEILHTKGVCHADQEKWDEALEEYRQGLELRKAVALPADHPDFKLYLRNLARSHGYLGDAQVRKGLLEDARSSYQEAEKLRAQLAESGNPDDLCLHARDDGNFAEFYEWQGETMLEQALTHRQQRVRYYESCLNKASVLPGQYRNERAEARLSLVELVLDLPPVSGSEVYLRYDKAQKELTESEIEFRKLMNTFGSSIQQPDLMAGLARVHLAWARLDLVRSRNTYQPIPMDHAQDQLQTAEELLSELDRAGKAQALDYYSWAALLALEGQLAESTSERKAKYVLALDRLDKSRRLGFVKQQRLRRDMAFAGIKLDADLGPKLEDLILRCSGIASQEP